MIMEQPIGTLKKAERIPAGTTYVASMGDGSGTALVSQELLEKEVGEKVSVDVLDTQEEIEANTEEGKAAGALAVKEMVGALNDKLTNYDHTIVISDGTYCTNNKYWNVERIGMQVNMYGRVYLSPLEASTWYTIGHLPDGYKPNITHSNCLFSINGGAEIECNITSSGSIDIRPKYAISREGWYTLVSITWITEL